MVKYCTRLLYRVLSVSALNVASCWDGVKVGRGTGTGIFSRGESETGTRTGKFIVSEFWAL